MNKSSLRLLAALLAAAPGFGQTVPPDIEVLPLTLAFGDQTVGTSEEPNHHP